MATPAALESKALNAGPEAADLYLTLLKSSLLDAVYGSQDCRTKVRKSAEEVAVGNYWPLRAHTMIGGRRLDNIHFCVEQVLKENVPGDLIECGVWRGGATILMRGVLAAYGIKNRKVFVADSFAGLPPPDARYAADAGAGWHTIPELAVSLDTVRANFKTYNLLDEQVVFIKGFFEDTLPTAPIDTLSILRLDGDMYGSTMHILDALYHKVSKGGYIIVDDYVVPSAKAAIHDFRARHNITTSMELIDTVDNTHPSVFWKKDN